MADILSGCYWSDDPDCPDGNAQAGYIYVLAGTEGGDFSKATPLLTADDKPLTNVPLSQEALDNYDSDSIEWANICTSQFAADYDADGDLDLITGAMRNQFFVHVNSADSASASPVFADAPVKLDVELPDQHSDPHMVDWDSDGDLDLLSGSSSGSVYLSVNEGSASEPKWADFKCLIKNESNWSQSSDDEAELKLGHGVRVCVTDFNRDGKLDLLVGDATTVENKIPGLTAEKASQLEKEYEEEMQPIHNEMQQIHQKYEADVEKVSATRNKDAVSELQKKIMEETKELQQKMMELRKKEKLFRDHSSTGHVWVYLQK